MISAKKIVDELNKKNNSLFKSFFPNSNYNFNFRDIRNFKKLKTVIVIGMGGSVLGTQAIYSFLKHKIRKKFIFIDNLDERFLKKIKKENNLSRSLFLLFSSQEIRVRQ
jgi:Glucose-6-phosphate isomerase